VTTTSVHPSKGRSVPSASAALSMARTAVVPTATIRPPAARVAFTRAAVVAGTRACSGYGSSSDSRLATPVWRTTGVTPMPLATSRVTTSGVNGRPALGISLLPGSVT
jgi:hypothetical protein